MSSEPHEYLRHILVEANYLISQRTGLKFEDFVADETLRRAVVRSLEIIGEAAKKVPSEFRAQYHRRRRVRERLGKPQRVTSLHAGPPCGRIVVSRDLLSTIEY